MSTTQTPSDRVLDAEDAVSGLPPLVSRREAMELLGCGKTRLWELTRTGRLRVIRVGPKNAPNARMMIPRRALRDFMIENAEA